MTFDADRNKLIFKPGYDAANDPSNPYSKLKRIPVTIWLRSKGNSTVGIKKDIVVEIADSPRGFAVNTTVDDVDIDEGEEFIRTFDFINEDFPQGPFTVKTINLPKEFEVTVQNNTVTMKMNPNYFLVTVNDTCYSWKCFKDWENGKIEIIAPDGRRLVQDIEVRVNDERLTPKFVVPDQIEQGLEVSFVVSAMDQNAEVEPVISIKNRPRDGNISFEKLTVVKNDLKQTHMKFNWTNIPESRRGTSADFKFEACNYNTRQQVRNCIEKTITVKISEQTHSAPVITRSSRLLVISNTLVTRNRESLK